MAFIRVDSVMPRVEYHRGWSGYSCKQDSRVTGRMFVTKKRPGHACRVRFEKPEGTEADNARK